MAEHAKNTAGAARTKYARTVQRVQKQQQRSCRQKLVSISLSKLPFFSVCSSSVNAWLSS